MNIEEIGQANFSLPHDLVPLPSQGIFYKSKKKAIKVGYLTASDENFLASGTQLNGANIILTLLRNKIYEHDLRPDELLDGDIEAILIFLRNTSFGPEYKFSITDPSTGKPFDSEILLDELNIKQGTVKPDENGLFTTTLPRSGAQVKIRPLSFGEVMEIGRLEEQYPVGRTAPTVTWRLNKQIQEVNGDSDRGVISQFIDSLPIMDSKHIRKFLKDNVPSLDLTRNIIAPSGEKVTFEITFGVDFFRPFF
jgi:hypothetical protein